jgi:hypothetical protein
LVYFDYDKGKSKKQLGFFLPILALFLPDTKKMFSLYSKPGIMNHVAGFEYSGRCGKSLRGTTAALY